MAAYRIELATMAQISRIAASDETIYPSWSEGSVGTKQTQEERPVHRQVCLEHRLGWPPLLPQVFWRSFVCPFFSSTADYLRLRLSHLHGRLLPRLPASG